MKKISRFESNLVKILHAMVGQTPVAQVSKLLVRRWARPRCLSRDCVDLVQDTLAKGCTYWLSMGGWRNETYLRGEASQSGRLWERTPPQQLGMEFSGYGLDFLIWLVESDVSRDDVWQPFEPDALTIGDRLLLALAFDAVADGEIGLHWAQSEPFASDGLCALLHPELLAQTGREVAPDFTWWVSSAGQPVLEAVQHGLARLWLQLEASKPTIISRERMTALGQAQLRIGEAYLEAIDSAGRRDLARWMLIALRDAVAGSPEFSQWTGSVDVKGLRVAQRTDVYRDAVAFLALAAQLSGWQQQAAHTGYFDEGYAASQIWKSDWERYNSEATCAAAHSIVRQAEPLGT